MYSFGSFSDMIFLFWVCVILFSNEYVLHILRWCVLCFWFETYFHLYIMITLAWPIMEDIEPFDLGLGYRLREFETVTHFTFRSEQYYIHIHTLTLWTCWLTHFELDMTLPLVPLYYITILVRLSILQYHSLFLSIISLIWPGRVRDG